MKRKLIQVLIVILKPIIFLFFKKKFLKGRYFENNVTGWKWAIQAMWRQKILRFNKSVPWPMNHTSTLSNWRNIDFHVDDLNNFQSPGCYFQNFSAKIILGKGCYIAPNVGLITTNHDLNDLDKHLEGKDIVLGKKCWIGMNAVLLPGVHLGDHTVVGAGSVVTKSFPQGRLVIAGNPAKIIKSIE
ncbi:acyltransferase [Zobellia galactanivorans]|uniref:Capsular polysaccharide synthesis O-acetyltransferase CapJ n=1 Tax=Zobellia galactanivorans (strain DSM 12802 / CCUG 47099 / CIP 106680 / NCIMB 13871 / Dsij) TaxID=63186 RepID=G0LB56_ZOBGA|nr:acyltransferase [Zobellia galactanivorans]CAZ95797.1 Capsular polysaccharide synthesis O-acetyltransferase CapJ [Zobellia galactanivorans]